MAECAFCKADTELYENGVPVCLACEHKREAKNKLSAVRAVLVSDIVESTARVSAANEAFNKVLGQVPSGLPHPDGSQRIRNASSKLDAARKEMMSSHKRLNDFIEHGIVPEDLKPGS
jgi:hypothetical protein